MAGHGFAYLRDFIRLYRAGPRERVASGAAGGAVDGTLRWCRRRAPSSGYAYPDLRHGAGLIDYSSVAGGVHTDASGDGSETVAAAGLRGLSDPANTPGVR